MSETLAEKTCTPCRGGGFRLRLAPVMLLTSGTLCRNGSRPARGDGFGRRCFDLAGGSRADARFLGSGRQSMTTNSKATRT
jgi:hypothetical protein